MMIPGIVAQRRQVPGGGDPFWANVVSLLHFDGTDGSASFIDERGHIFTGFVSPTLSSATPKFGPTSLNVPSGSYLTTPASSDYSFSGVDFCVEFFARAPSYTTLMMVIGNRDELGRGWQIFFSATGNVTTQADATFLETASGIMTPNIWRHIALTRQGSTTRLFVDGSLQASGTLNITNNTAPLYVGRQGISPIYSYSGQLDEIRITKGVARYTSAFTPPTEAFPNS